MSEGVRTRDHRIALVTVNYGSHDLLATNLGWTSTVDDPALDVIVVDNYRTASASSAIATLARSMGWHLVSVPTNVGFGAGLNRGAQLAFEIGVDAVVVVNPDVRITHDDVRALHRAVITNPTAIVAPTVVDGNGRPWGRLGRVDLRRGRVFTSDRVDGPAWVSGASFAVRRDLWEALRGIDPDYFMYWEDVDLSVRAQDIGATVHVLADVTVTHSVGGTQSDDGRKTARYYYYNCRNRLVFASKRLSLGSQVRWVVHTPSDVRRVISRGAPVTRWSKVRHALLPALHGCLAGLWWSVRHARRGRVR